MPIKKIALKPGEEDRILAGHPWVYDNEAASIKEGPAPAGLIPGECVDVESAPVRGKPIYLGRALANPHSKIIARIYSPSKEGMDKGFFKRRFREAVKRRLFSPAPEGGPAHADSAAPVSRSSAAGLLDLSRSSLRLVFAEADFLPGLIIDRFVGWPLAEAEALDERPLRPEAAEAALGPPRSWLVAQFLSLGMDQRRDMIIEALEESLASPPLDLGLPAGIVEKSGAKVRELEGLPRREGLLKGDFPPGGIVFFENGFPFASDLPGGQKTGHFLDQRINRLLAGRWAALLAAERMPPNEEKDSAESIAPNDKQDAALRILDACSYTGGFGIHALRAAPGALLTAVDASGAALEALEKNAGLNGVADRLTLLEADVFETLRALERRKEKFDMIILDPPAFAKTRTVLAEALRGYKEINLRAMRLARRGGILVTCSCSQALDEARFRAMLVEAAADAERRLIQLDFRLQPPDHPVLLGYGESLYLKCGFYRVL